ncbi:MAG: polysaccharide biosynthesis tyrosine autokinase [Cyanobacteria bacterium P01_A01_bin.84]
MELKESFVSFEGSGKFLQRRILTGAGVFIPVFLVSLLAYSAKKPLYEAQGKLLFQRTDKASSLTGFGTEISKLEPVVQDLKTNPLNTESEVISSVPIVKKVISKLGLQNELGQPLRPENFANNLSVKGVRGTDVIQVTYQHTDPEIAAQIVNSIMDVYIESNILLNRYEATSARKFIDKQLPNAELLVRQAEAALRNFKEQNNIVSVQEETNRSVEILKELQRNISTTRSQISDTGAQTKMIRQKLGMTSEKAMIVTSLSQSEGVQNIIREIQELESLIADKRTILKDTHPNVIKLKTKLLALQNILKQRMNSVAGSEKLGSIGNINDIQAGNLKQQLSAELITLEARKLGLSSELATLSSQENLYRQRLSIMPKLEQQERELERKLKAAQSTYSLLLQKLQEARISENQTLGNARILAKASVPEKPSSSATTGYIGAGLAGILLALLAMYILETKDKSIKTVDEAKELTGLTLLGLIPSFSKSKKSLRSNQEIEPPSAGLIVRDNPRSPVSEAYRMLRANLKFMSADKELKVIVVTSSVPKEGKSTVAANLAMSIAQMESRVLLVDADLHNPIQHQVWEVSNNEGLSNVIVGQVEVMRAIKNVEGSLDILTSGVVPPSPGSLLDSKRMASLIDSFAAYYEYVIIDAPALNLAADAATLGQMADGLLFVVRPGVVDSVNATLAKEILEKSGQNVLGQVVNGVIPENEAHSYYYFEEEYNSQETFTIKNIINNLKV